MQPGPVRYGRIWQNLPLRVKAWLYLALPLPLAALAIQFRAALISWMVLELVAAVWIVETIIRSVADLRHATGRICQGASPSEIRPHSWELNVVGHNLSSVAEALDRQRRAAETAEARDAELLEERRLMAEKTEQCELQVRVKEEEAANALATAAEANDARNSFLSNMSDELRAPLNGVLGFTELLFDGKVGSVSAEQRECLGDVLASARQLYRMVDGLLNTGGARPEEWRAASRETVDLDLLIRDVRYVTEVLSAKKRGVRIAIEVEAGIRQVSADAARLKQLVQSYLTTATEFSPAGGQVVVRASAEDANEFRLEVEHSRTAVLTDKIEDGPWQYPGSAAKLALVRDTIDALGGRMGGRNVSGRRSVLYAVLPMAQGAEVSRPETAGRNLFVIDVPAVESFANLIQNPADSDHVRATLENAGVFADGRGTVFVLGEEQKLPATLALLGYRYLCVASRERVLRTAAHNPPAAVIVNLEDRGVGEMVFIETALRAVGLVAPVIGCAADVEPMHRRSSSSETREGSGRMALKPVEANGRKRTA